MALKGKPRDMNKWREVLLDPNVHFPGESSEYRRVRNELLEAEAELRRLNEQVAAQRRSLPAGCIIREDYVFESAADGSKVRFSELFAPGKNSLVKGAPSLSKQIYEVGPVGHETTGHGENTERVNRRQTMPGCKRDDEIAIHDGCGIGRPPSGTRANDSMARSISAAFSTRLGTIWTATDGAAASAPRRK